MRFCDASTLLDEEIANCEYQGAAVGAAVCVIFVNKGKGIYKVR